MQIETQKGLKEVTPEKIEGLLEAGKLKHGMEVITLDGGLSFVSVEEALRRHWEAEEDSAPSNSLSENSRPPLEELGELCQSAVSRLRAKSSGEQSRLFLRSLAGMELVTALAGGLYAGLLLLIALIGRAPGLLRLSAFLFSVFTLSITVFTIKDAISLWKETGQASRYARNLAIMSLITLVSLFIFFLLDGSGGIITLLLVNYFMCVGGLGVLKILLIEIYGNTSDESEKKGQAWTRIQKLCYPVAAAAFAVLILFTVFFHESSSERSARFEQEQHEELKSFVEQCAALSETSPDTAATMLAEKLFTMHRGDERISAILVTLSPEEQKRYGGVRALAEPILHQKRQEQKESLADYKREKQREHPTSPASQSKVRAYAFGYAVGTKVRSNTGRNLTHAEVMSSLQGLEDQYPELWKAKGDIVAGARRVGFMMGAMGEPALSSQQILGQ